MARSDLSNMPWHGGEGWFTTTHWSVVLSAKDPSAPLAQEALEELCRTYWYPIYAYSRRRGYSPHDAQDLTQGFFSRLLQKNDLDQVERTKGRFRSFLIASLHHYMSNELDSKRRVKRGGRFQFVSWDEVDAEGQYQNEPTHDLTADKVFERSWALTLLEKVLEQLRTEYAGLGKSSLFEVLQNALTGDGESHFAVQASEKLKMGRGAVRMAILRLRRRYAQLLRFEIAHTVRRESDIEDEIRVLFGAWS